MTTAKRIAEMKKMLPQHLRWTVAYRRTGRTTRLIEKAKKLCVEGKAVYVLVTEGTEDFFKRAFAGFSGISVENVRRFPEFDWATMTLPRAHQNCVVLVDHFLIEQRFMDVLAELHAYDEDA